MNDLFTTALKAAGQSVTRPRILILQELAVRGPIEAPRLAEAVTGKVDRATVYRTIELLEHIGFTRSVANGYQRLIELGDRFDPHHHHVTCVSCGKRTNLSDPSIEAGLEAMARRVGYKLASHQLELAGICLACRTKGR